jgi:hypothetical protein
MNSFAISLKHRTSNHINSLLERSASQTVQLGYQSNLGPVFFANNRNQESAESYLFHELKNTTIFRGE